MEISHSVLSYRFRVVVMDRRWTEDESFAVTLNTVSCSMDYCNKAVNVVFRQPLIADIQHLAMRMAEQGMEQLKIDALSNRGDEVLYSVLFTNLKPQSHRTTYDYLDGNPVTHSFVFQADTMWIEDSRVV